MKALIKPLVVLAMLFPLLQLGAVASAQDRTTWHDHLLTAGTVATTCPETGQPGDTCDDYTVAAAVGTERADGVRHRVNRVQVLVSHDEWGTFEDGSSGWMGTSFSEGTAMGGASISPDLRTASLDVNDLELYAVQEDGSETPTGQTLSATVRIRANGSLQYLWSATTERGVYPGPLTQGHFERWRSGIATTTIDGSATPSIDWVTYVGWYVGNGDARFGSSGRSVVNSSFLNAKRPGMLTHVTQVGYAEGSFGTFEIDRMQDGSDPTQVKTMVIVNGEWVDLTGDSSVQLSQAADLSGGTATVPVNSTTWSVVWTASGPTQAQRYFGRNRSFADGMRDRSQSRGYFQQRPQDVTVTIGDKNYPGTGYLILDQGSYVDSAR